MKSRTFNSWYMPHVNNSWVGRKLGVPVNSSGIDLFDEERGIGVEVKFGLCPNSWTVLESQMDYGRDIESYWALGIYELKKPVHEISFRELPMLERFVKRREVYLVEWGWMEQFPSSVVSGQTARSSWNYVLRYPKLKEMPRVIASFPVLKGRICFTEGVNPETFNFRG